MATRAVERLMVLAAITVLTVSAATADPFMGEYAGTFYADSRTQMPATARVVAEDTDEWRVVIDAPGIAGKEAARIEVRGTQADQRVAIDSFSGGYRWRGGIENGRLSVRSEYAQHFELDKIVRRSPNEGLEPPAGAVVLLPYKKDTQTDLNAWTNQNWKALDNGAMQVAKGSNVTKEQFGDIRHLHVEFWLPLEPSKRGQGRANSGVYVHSYEVQVLDSFGLVHTSGDCGGLYNFKRADVNASLPPETWQTYDIEFRAARPAGGAAPEQARITVWHNGVKIHDNVEIPRPANQLRAAGPIQLQDHGHPIHYRNIWLVKGE